MEKRREGEAKMELMVQMVIMVMVMMVELVFFAGHEITRYLISIFREDRRWYFYAKWREAVLGLIQISNKQGGSTLCRQNESNFAYF